MNEPTMHDELESNTVTDCATDVVEPMNVDEAVRSRYSQAAEQREPELCCPVDYDDRFLKVIPQEILERDYGCGDPSRFLRAGEHVLDLGSGGGKICYIAAQVVGPQGSVTGVDCNAEMLELARKYRGQIAEQLGYDNVTFAKGRIQDLKLDLELLDPLLGEHPIESAADWLALQEKLDELRIRQPMIANEAVDVVVSNCVLNLVKRSDRHQLFGEIFRVLKPGARAVISDIVSNADVPERLQNDARLWSGCISGAFREDRFIDAFSDAGFHGMQIVSRQVEPWAVVEGIEFRSVTVEAHKSHNASTDNSLRQVIYHGPWSAVMDDLGRELIRGQPMEVTGEEYNRYCYPPYASSVTAVPTADDAGDEPLDGDAASTTTALDIMPTGDCCGPGNCC